MHEQVRAILLAAGRSTRFRGRESKLLTPICGRPMVLYPLTSLAQLGVQSTVVVGHMAEHVIETVKLGLATDVNFILQEHQLGTGHALACTTNQWNKPLILVLNGDMPLVTTDLLKTLVESHEKTKAQVSIVSSFVTNPTGYGRVIEDGRTRIVEERDCSDEERRVQKINAGVYLFSKNFLSEHVMKISANNAAHEFYLTDLVELASKNGCTVNSLNAQYDIVRGVNSLAELQEVEELKRKELIRKWTDFGIKFEMPDSNRIDVDVEIGTGTTIGFGANLLGKTKIGRYCSVSHSVIINNSTIGDETILNPFTIIQNSVVGQKCLLGPFANLHTESVIGDQAVIGNFVEIKKSELHQQVKAKHLTYLGDATIGAETNIGAGTITCNYDGTQKHKTIIGQRAFIGSNNSLIAPLIIGDDAFTAGGSVITDDVPNESLAIGRAKQVTKKGYSKKKQPHQCTSKIEN